MKNEELLNFKDLSAFSCSSNCSGAAKWGFPYEEYGFSLGGYGFLAYLCIVNIKKPHKYFEI